jgi:hypothetical protein
MFHLPFLYELSPFYLVQAALTIWMLIDANRRGVDQFWFWIILLFQPIGPWAYFFMYKIKDFRGSSGSWRNLFQRRPSLDVLRYQVEQAPTSANRLELGERLVEVGEYGEALMQLEEVLDRESEHCQCLFLVAQCHRNLGRPVEAVPPLQRLIARNSSWSDFLAWRTLVDACYEAGDCAEALTHCRELVRLAPSLQHRCMLAERLADAGDRSEARRVVESGLAEFRFMSGPGRRRDSRWVSKAKQLIKELS